ncbi:MAG: Por secretion system protein, partial [Phototrophicales bacterium]
MNLSTDSTRFWIDISGLTPDKEYRFQYVVDGKIRVGDPYSEKVLDPYNDKYISSTTYPNLIPYPEGKTTEYVSVLQTAKTPYVWQSGPFEKPRVKDLVVYEL